MVRTAWRAALPGFLFLFATFSEALAAYAGGRFFPLDIGKCCSHRGRFRRTGAEGAI
jgi:hypothetical protein